MTQEELKAWLNKTERSEHFWLSDIITKENYGDFLFYRGGTKGRFIQINIKGFVTYGTYTGAFPHIGEASFNVSFTETYLNQMEALHELCRLIPELRQALVEHYCGAPSVH